MMTNRWPTFAAVSAALGLSACTVGPDYRRPDIATPSAYSEIGDAKSAPFSRPTSGEADLSAWWTQFNDPVLDGLVSRALAQNLDLKTATSRLRQAREQEVIAGSAGLPHVGADAMAARLQTSSKSLALSGLIDDVAGGTGGAAGAAPNTITTPNHLDLFTLAFDATWEVDIFGGVRRGVQAARATTEAAVWRRRDGEVSLTAEVADDYLMLRAVQQQIAVAQNEVKAQQATSAIIGQQAQTGFVTRLNVNQQEAQVDSTIAAIPQLQADARTQIHALGVLLAQDPDSLDAQLSPVGVLPKLPAELPVGLPSDLLRRRPDVRAAERALAAATASIGVQVADLYPKFNILAAGPAFAGTSVTHLFNADNATAAAVGMIQWPIFQGGRIRAGIRSARAQADQAYLAYQQTILSALQNVEDALARTKSDQQRIVPLQRSLSAAQNSLLISRQQYQVGLVTFLTVLQAQTSVLNAQNQLVQANASLARDLASLYKALGGGWSADEGAPGRFRGLRNTP